MGNAGGDVGHACGKALVETPGQNLHVNACFQVFQKVGEHCAGVEHERLVLLAMAVSLVGVADGEPVACDLVGRAGRGVRGRRLEQACRLAVVACHVHEAQDGGDCVEQPARRARQGAVEVAGDHLKHDRSLDAHLVGQVAGAGAVAKTCLGKQRVGVAQGLAHGGGASGQGPVGDVGSAGEVDLVAHHDLAAPDAPVGAVAGPVEGDAHHMVPHACLCQRRGDVGMVVLHLAQGQALLVGHLARPFAREVLGVHVAGQDLGGQAEKPLVLAERAAPGVK